MTQKTDTETHTVQDLIDDLQEIENKDMPVVLCNMAQDLDTYLTISSCCEYRDIVCINTHGINFDSSKQTQTKAVSTSIVQDNEVEDGAGLYNKYGPNYLNQIKAQIAEMPICRLDKLSYFIKQRRKAHQSKIKAENKVRIAKDILEAKAIIKQIEPIVLSVSNFACSGCPSYGDAYADCGTKHPDLATCETARQSLKRRVSKSILAKVEQDLKGDE